MAQIGLDGYVVLSNIGYPTPFQWYDPAPRFLVSGDHFHFGPGNSIFYSCLSTQPALPYAPYAVALSSAGGPILARAGYLDLVAPA